MCFLNNNYKFKFEKLFWLKLCLNLEEKDNKYKRNFWNDNFL